MSTFDNAVSIHPYFKVKEGQMEACKSFLAQFCEKVASEEKCLYYNFTFKGDVLFCREAYQDAAAVQAHLESCSALLGEFGKITEVLRVEVHGPAAELEKLKAGLAGLNPEYFVCECGIGR